MSQTTRSHGPGGAPSASERMRRVLVLAYGVATYALFFGVFVYAAGFVGNLVVPRSLDGAPGAPETPLGEALLVNGALLGLFAVQHSVMARKSFKRVWTRIVPASVERNTYVLFTCFALIAMFLFWRPMPGVIWSVEHPALRGAIWAVYGFGWLTVFLATCMINHFDLFGLRQAWLRFRGRPYTELGFRTPGFYRFVRHPIQLGFLIAFWATPDMTVGRLLFAAGTTGYILVALKLEERDLVREFGDLYRMYRRSVRAFLPVRRGAPPDPTTASAAVS